MEIKRGDIVLCVVAGDFGKPRPALVAQSDLYNPTHASAAVLPITSHRVEAPLFRKDINPNRTNGLKVPSQIMVDKVTAVRRDRIREKIGRASPAVIAATDTALALFLGLSSD